MTQSESARASLTFFGSILERKAQKAQKFLSLDLVCTPVLMLDRIWSRGCELWCFHGRGVSGSTDTLSTLAGILGETDSGTVSKPVLEPVPEPVLEPVSWPVREELS